MDCVCFGFIVHEDKGCCSVKKIAKTEIFDYIEAFYKRTQRYSFLCDVILEAYQRASV